MTMQRHAASGKHGATPTGSVAAAASQAEEEVVVRTKVVVGTWRLPHDSSEG